MYGAGRALPRSPRALRCPIKKKASSVFRGRGCSQTRQGSGTARIGSAAPIGVSFGWCCTLIAAGFGGIDRSQPAVASSEHHHPHELA